MRYAPVDVLAEDEIKALANKWWGNGPLPRHYFDALREAARLGAERAARTTHDHSAKREKALA